jgi:fructose-bisphosphate aldolase, class I
MSNRRLSRIFRPDHHTFIVAIDHGLTEGPVKGLESLEAILPAIIAGGADAVLASYGTAIRFERALALPGLILRIDGGTTSIGSLTPAGSFYSVADALRLGADAVAVSAFPGTAQEEMSLRSLAATITEAHRWGMPVLGEMAVGGFDSGPEFHTAEKVAIAARVASELGADFLKLPYAEGYGRVVRASFVPVVMLGGVKSNDPRVVLSTIHAAIQAGAAGVAMGRNIFQADNPGAMTRAVAAILHGGAGVEAALQILRASAQ